MRDALARYGADPIDMTQTEFARFVVEEVDTATRIIGERPKPALATRFLSASNEKRGLPVLDSHFAA